MNHYQQYSPENRELTAKDKETIDRFVPMSFREYLVAMIDDDKVAAQLAAEIGLGDE